MFLLGSMLFTLYSSYALHSFLHLTSLQSEDDIRLYASFQNCQHPHMRRFRHSPSNREDQIDFLFWCFLGVTDLEDIKLVRWYHLKYFIGARQASGEVSITVPSQIFQSAVQQIGLIVEHKVDVAKGNTAVFQCYLQGSDHNTPPLEIYEHNKPSSSHFLP